METIDKFAVFILTHGRPDRVITYNTLKKQGYTGDIYIVIDNEDKTADQYRERFEDKVIVFDKLDIASRFDTGDNFKDRRAVFFARNACFEIARGLGLDYFLQLDDDYTAFDYTFTESLKYWWRPVKNLDRVISAALVFYKNTPIDTLAFCQGGDLIGGSKGGDGSRIWLKRKAMNTFFCRTDNPVSFVGRINEDVNTYTSLGNRGKLFLTMFNASITQETTQAHSGGMSELCLDQGTYIKSFYTVMYCPSFTKINAMGHTHRRLHHRITWDNAVPCIIDEKHRKAARYSEGTVNNG